MGHTDYRSKNAAINSKKSTRQRQEITYKYHSTLRRIAHQIGHLTEEEAAIYDSYTHRHAGNSNAIELKAKHYKAYSE